MITRVFFISDIGDKIKMLYHEYPNASKLLNKYLTMDYHFAPKVDMNLINFFANHGLHINLWSDYYEDGVNWLWQINWPYPHDSDKLFYRGTAIYGDNHEHATYHEACKEAFKMGMFIIECRQRYYGWQDINVLPFATMMCDVKFKDDTVHEYARFSASDQRFFGIVMEDVVVWKPSYNIG